MLKNLAPKARGLTVPRARRLRQSMSLPEVMLWRELRGRPGGLKFRRQHASGPYILDFFCSDARLHSKSTAKRTRATVGPPAMPIGMNGLLATKSPRFALLLAM